jgi:hypothetical protein
MKKAFLFLILFFLACSKPALALENNQFGIHITQTGDLTRAAELVNSSGGDWGYVTVVIQDNDRDQKKWQEFFDLCREKHLIPLVRIASHLKAENWEIPTQASINDWANFLDSLNWPVKNRYLIVFNEPNHDKEWGGKANPEEYALILEQALTIFKQKNPDFSVLNAGFDQAAPNSKTTIEELKFLKAMNTKVPGIFSRLDGWVSHSYPNHGFVGKPWESGKATIKGYAWELGILKNNFAVNKELPVFITETGWPKRIAISNQQSVNFYDEKTAAEYFKLAFQDIWLPDKKVAAITPFILNYPFSPFANFSWLDAEGNPYPQYEIVKKMAKIKGQPVQIIKFEMMKTSLPSFLPANLIFKGKVFLKNTGQSIWGEEPFEIKSQSPYLKLTSLKLVEGKLIKPGEIAELDFSLEASNITDVYQIAWEGLPQYELKVFEVWNLTNNQDTVFNRVFKKLFEFWYR